MNKSLHVVIYCLLLIGLYFGAAIAFQSCGGDKKKEEPQDLNSRLEGVADENTHSSESFFEDESPGYESATTESGIEPDYTTGSSSQEAGEVDYTAPVTSAPATKTPPKSTPLSPTTTTPRSVPPATSTSSYSGDFMLVAGNYLVESNASSMVTKLKAQGYSSAEHVVFDLSQYYTVIAGRYNTRNAADQASASLKRKGFDNYVLKSKN